MAVLKQSGKVDSLMQRFMRLVMGSRRESRQDFRTGVGMKSRVQVESEDAMIAALTSSGEAGVKSVKLRGGLGGAMWGDAVDVERDA